MLCTYIWRFLSLFLLSQAATLLVCLHSGRLSDVTSWFRGKFFAMKDTTVLSFGDTLIRKERSRPPPPTPRDIRLFSILLSRAKSMQISSYWLYWGLYCSRIWSAFLLLFSSGFFDNPFFLEINLLNNLVLWIFLGFNADPDPVFISGSQTNADPDPDPVLSHKKLNFLHENYTLSRKKVKNIR